MTKRQRQVALGNKTRTTLVVGGALTERARQKGWTALAVLVEKQGDVYEASCRQDCAEPNPAWDCVIDGPTEQDAIDNLEMAMGEIAPSPTFYFSRITRG